MAEPNIVSSPWGDIPFPAEMGREEINRAMRQLVSRKHAEGDYGEGKHLATSPNPMQTRTPTFGTPKLAVSNKPMRSEAPQPAPPPSPTFGTLDLTLPIDQVREQIKAIPDEATRVKAMDAWANYVVQAEHDRNTKAGGISQTGQSASDLVRSTARGAPFIGPFLDELNAKMAPGDYNENYAYQKARDRYMDRVYPVLTPALGFLGGAVGGYKAGAAGREMVTRHAPVQTARFNALPTPARMGAGAAGGAVIGGGETAATIAGNTEGNIPTRLKAIADRPGTVATGAALGGAAGTLAPALQGYVNWKYPTGRTTPGVDAAAGRLGVELPFFARAENPLVRDTGMKISQRPTVLGHDLRAPLERGTEQTSQAASDTVTGLAGAPPVSAPYVGGSAVADALERRKTQMIREEDVLGTRQRNLLPDDTVVANVDLPNTRQTNQSILRTERGQRTEDPGRYLDQARGLVWDAHRGRLSWPNAYGARGDYGEARGIPLIASADAPRKKETSGAVYGAMSRDLEAAADQHGVGPQFTATNDAIRGLKNRERDLDTFRGQAQAPSGNPENLVRLAYGDATTRGGAGGASGTDINRLRALFQHLSRSPNAQDRLRGAVLAHMVNDARGNPVALAQRIRTLPDENRQLLFPGQTGQRVADLQTLGDQLGLVGANRNTSGTAGSALLNAADDPKRVTGAVKTGLAALLGGWPAALGYGALHGLGAAAFGVGRGRRRMQLLHGDMSPSLRNQRRIGAGVNSTTNSGFNTNLRRDQQEEDRKSR